MDLIFLYIGSNCGNQNVKLPIQMLMLLNSLELVLISTTKIGSVSVHCYTKKQMIIKRVSFRVSFKSEVNRCKVKIYLPYTTYDWGMFYHFHEIHFSEVILSHRCIHNQCMMFHNRSNINIQMINSVCSICFLCISFRPWGSGDGYYSSWKGKNVKK